MIDLKNDDLLTLTQATQHIPGRPHVSTVFRWTANLALDSIKVGGRRFTSTQAIDAFIARCSRHKPQGTPTRQSAARADNAEAELARDGI